MKQNYLGTVTVHYRFRNTDRIAAECAIEQRARQLAKRAKELGLDILGAEVRSIVLDNVHLAADQ